MGLEIFTITVDAWDPHALGRFWAEALGWTIKEEESDGDGDYSLVVRPDRTTAMLFGVSTDEKAGKNRWHLDLTPDDQAVEVARLEGLGATRIDIGQGEKSWVVMADPEGNEFCVLAAEE